MALTRFPPTMGFSLGGVFGTVANIVTAPLQLEAAVASKVIGAGTSVISSAFKGVGSVVGSAVGAAGSVAGAAVGAAKSTIAPITSALGVPSTAQVTPTPVPQSTTNWPLIIGGGAAGLLLLVLLMRRPSGGGAPAAPAA